MRPAYHPQSPLSGAPLRRFVSLLFLLTCVATSAPAQSPPNRIPNLQSTTLTGQPIDLPAAFGGKIGILIIGFSRESRTPAAEWGKRLAADFEHSPDILYFELPVLEDVPRLLRGVVLHAIARDLSPRAQSHFLPITANEAAWKSAAHFAEPDAAYVLVVDGSGNIRWQTSGDPIDERYTSLRRALPHPASTTP